jgi:predicted transposase YdaD
MKYDITLKTLLQKAPHRLLQMLVNSQPQEILTVEYPSVKDRRPDLVVRLLVDGRLYHLELQTANDVTMPQRMLDYFTLLLMTYQQEPFQQVLYVGSKTLSMTNHLTLNKLQFEYEIIDIRHLDC